MKKKLFFVFLVFFIGIYCVLAKDREEVIFSKCVDGDTVKVLIGNKEETVRLLAVDTPETVSPEKDAEYYGKEASNFTCNKISKANVLELEYDSNSDKKDKYDRLLAWVFIDDVLLQKILVEGGYAKVAYLYGDYKYTSILKEYEVISKEQKIGIWDDIARSKFENNDLEFSWIQIVLILVVILILIILKDNKNVKKILKEIKKKGRR